jgi:hypothetical protein
MNGQKLAAAALTTGVYLLISFLIALPVAFQARRRGHSFLAWLAAGTLVNPIFFLVLLAIMPDRARQARRRQELADLDARLAALGKSAGEPATLPAAPGAVPQQSLGDQPTVAPPLRSLGDEETRA